MSLDPAGKQRAAKWPLIVVPLVILILVGQCSKSDDESSSHKSSSTTTTATISSLAPTTAPGEPAAPAGPKPPTGVDFHTEPGTSGEILFAQFDISDNLTKGFIRRGAQYKTVDILKYVNEVYPGVSKVWVQGSFPTTDAYGNTHNGIVLNAEYGRSTLDKINFDGIDSGKIWDIRDGGMVHPDLQG